MATEPVNDGDSTVRGYCCLCGDPLVDDLELDTGICNACAAAAGDDEPDY